MRHVQLSDLIYFEQDLKQQYIVPKFYHNLIINISQGKILCALDQNLDLPLMMKQRQLTRQQHVKLDMKKISSSLWNKKILKKRDDNHMKNLSYMLVCRRNSICTVRTWNQLILLKIINSCQIIYYLCWES
ncbi:hypothetical protein pb186bvf_019721 [Paramecium bursaria]